MADQVSSIAGGVTGTGLGEITGALQGGLTNLLNFGQSYLDRWFPPEKREELKAKLIRFATERPKFAAFLFSQIVLSGIPLALFVVMSLTVLVFALVAGILVGVVGALLFTVFCVGVALLFLLPTLFMTTAAATFIFLWGLGAYYIIKWFNQKDVPGIHTDVDGGLKDKLGLNSIVKSNGELPGPLGEKRSQPLQEKDGNAAGRAKSGPGEDEDKENKPPSSRSDSREKSHTPAGKGTGTDVPVGEVKRKVGGITSGIGL